MGYTFYVAIYLYDPTRPVGGPKPRSLAIRRKVEGWPVLPRIGDGITLDHLDPLEVKCVEHHIRGGAIYVWLPTEKTEHSGPQEPADLEWHLSYWADYGFEVFSHSGPGDS